MDLRTTLAPAPPRRPLASHERAALRTLATAMAGFGAYGLATGAPSTAAYLATVAAVAAAVALCRRAPIPRSLTRGLTLLAVAHLAGGLVGVGDNVLYNASPGTDVLRYDHLVHAGGVFVGTLVLWTMLGRGPCRNLLVVCALAGLGLGALNETIEFLATLAHHGSHVGGYTNTGWDLVSNVVGASAAGVVAGRRRSPA